MDGIWFKPIFLETWVLLDSLPVNRRAITYLDLRKGINPLAFFVLYLEFESWLMRYYSFTGNWRLFTFYENSFAITPNLNPNYCDILASKEATRLTQGNHISRPMKKYKLTCIFTCYLDWIMRFFSFTGNWRKLAIKKEAICYFLRRNSCSHKYYDNLASKDALWQTPLAMVDCGLWSVRRLNQVKEIYKDE